jgi:hypothetical protein
MSTTELKSLIDARTSEEKMWIAAYLLNELRTSPELKQTEEELAELARRRADLQSGRQRVTQAEAEAHWMALEREGG